MKGLLSYLLRFIGNNNYEGYDQINSALGGKEIYSVTARMRTDLLGPSTPVALFNSVGEITEVG